MSFVRLVLRFLPELILTIGLAVGHRWFWISLVVAVIVFFVIKSRE
ncbi:hypothetical protein [Actinoplanes regularis]|nr:hypothetical protein [Actinoplanes regularis]GLW33089.1 hypothetical protein Areg01_60270 [Actinoplanes regularis]